MKRVVLLILCVLVVVIVGLPVEAAGERWSAWLYDSPTGRMFRLDETGAALEVALPLNPGFDVYGHNVAVSRGGTVIAYMVYSNASAQGYLLVYDTTINGWIASYSLPPTAFDSMSFHADEYLFNEDDSALAFGFGLADGGWQVIVLDLRTGDSTMLTHDNPIAVGAEIASTFGMTPTVQLFEDDRISFTMIMGGTEGAPEYYSYAWDMSANSISRDVAFVTPDNDYLPATGEVIMPRADYSLPNRADEFIFWQANALAVYDPALEGHFPFYSDANSTFYWPRFIQNGERILMGAYGVGDTPLDWMVIERDGSNVGTIPMSGLTSIRGLSDGFIYATDAGNRTTLLEVNTRDGLDNGTPIWTSPEDTHPRIVWALDVTARDAGPFRPWRQLAALTTAFPNPSQAPVLTPTVIAPLSIPTATPLGTTAGRLAVGGQAIVHTTEGDTLNVRSGPGRNFEVAGQAADGTRVTLLEGPRSADGLVWWRIRLPNGVEGWAVESVDDNGTRLQTLVPFP